MPRSLPLIALLATLAGCAALLENTAQEDAQLVRVIVQANLAEIAAGKLAAARARSPPLRRLGERMAREHTQLQAEASELKSAQGVPLPTRPDADQEALLRKLRALPRADFDDVYLDSMVKAHEELVRVLARGAARARDPALRAHAQNALPRIRQHLELARRLAAAAKASFLRRAPGSPTHPT